MAINKNTADKKELKSREELIEECYNAGIPITGDEDLETLELYLASGDEDDDLGFDDEDDDFAEDDDDYYKSDKDDYIDEDDLDKNAKEEDFYEEDFDFDDEDDDEEI